MIQLRTEDGGAGDGVPHMCQVRSTLGASQGHLGRRCQIPSDAPLTRLVQIWNLSRASLLSSEYLEACTVMYDVSCNAPLRRADQLRFEIKRVTENVVQNHLPYKG